MHREITNLADAEQTANFKPVILRCERSEPRRMNGPGPAVALRDGRVAASSG
jgi:hypothetical protein